MSELSYEVDFTAGIEPFEPIQRTYFVNFVDETNRLVKAGPVGRIRAVWGVVVLSRPQGDGLAQQFEMVNKELEDVLLIDRLQTTRVCDDFDSVLMKADFFRYSRVVPIGLATVILRSSSPAEHGR
ncbi:hypothetical protein B0H11DRAFT_1905266 [Mycena galericulata]|nr:hypothetical protein B0H11DRAFT_1905266 [Mycena galericulata]